MKKLLIIALVVIALSGCVSQKDAQSYSNIDLVKCSVSNKSPDGLWDDTAGHCTAELESRIQAGKISQQELAVGNSGGVLGVEAAASVPRVGVVMVGRYQ